MTATVALSDTLAVFLCGVCRAGTSIRTDDGCRCGRYATIRTVPQAQHAILCDTGWSRHSSGIYTCPRCHPPSAHFTVGDRVTVHIRRGAQTPEPAYQGVVVEDRGDVVVVQQCRPDLAPFHPKRAVKRHRLGPPA